MFGCIPGTFENPQAAKLASSSFQMEERDSKWVVVKKENEIGNVFYRPCRMDDLNQAKSDGWFLYTEV